jgi:hypothetical protein
MNLKRLLTVGGSLEARKGATGRYRMAQGGTLPKFELRGDTLTAVPIEGVVRLKGAPVKDSAGPLFDSPAEPARNAGAGALIVSSAPKSPIVAAGNPFSSEAPPRPVSTGILKGLLDSIGSALSDAFSGRRNRARRRAVRESVQGELGLDSVRPLRNDLSGSDFEVVAAPVPRPGLLARGSLPSRTPAEPAAPADGAPPVHRSEVRLLGAED